jgi:hypothetical protein
MNLIPAVPGATGNASFSMDRFLWGTEGAV